MNRKPSWKGSPQWSRWLAQDCSGYWVWFEKKPKPWAAGIWLSDGRHEMVEGERFDNLKWKTTLEKRPGGVKR